MHVSVTMYLQLPQRKPQPKRKLNIKFVTFNVDKRRLHIRATRSLLAFSEQRRRGKGEKRVSA